MPNPLDRGPSSTPEAGSFVSLGVENVGAEGKVLGEKNASTTERDLGDIALTYQDFPNLVKTRELLETDTFKKFGIYNSDTDNTQLVSKHILNEVHLNADFTWARIEKLAGGLRSDISSVILDAVAVQRKLAPAYAFLPHDTAIQVRNSLMDLSKIATSDFVFNNNGSGVFQRDKAISYSADNSENGVKGCMGSTSLAAINLENGILNSKLSTSFAGNNGLSGNKESTRSVSFAAGNRSSGCWETIQGVSFARFNGHDSIFNSTASVAAILEPNKGKSKHLKLPFSLIAKSSFTDKPTYGNLAIVIGDQLPEPDHIYGIPNESEAITDDLIIIEDRNNDVTQEWENEAWDNLVRNKFFGRLIVGGKFIYNNMGTIT